MHLGSFTSIRGKNTLLRRQFVFVCPLAIQKSGSGQRSRARSRPGNPLAGFHRSIASSRAPTQRVGLYSFISFFFSNADYIFRYVLLVYVFPVSIFARLSHWVAPRRFCVPRGCQRRPCRYVCNVSECLCVYVGVYGG